jgi:hypothetical protein
MKKMGGAFMIDTVNFIVRSSGRVDGSYYIDYIGLYKTADIAKAAKVDPEKLTGIYLSNGGGLDTALEIFYFDNMISAQKTISEIFSIIKKTNKGRVITLTEPEIEYIRKALINESGFAGINNKLKDAIFKKLNG